MTLVDLGAGTGYFLPHLSQAVGPEGKVVGLDIEQDMVRYMSERAQREHLANVTARVVPLDAPQLLAASADRVLIVDTWHHIDGRPAYAAKLRAALAPGGTVYVVDFKPEASYSPPREHRLTAKQVAAELGQGGCWPKSPRWRCRSSTSSSVGERPTQRAGSLIVTGRVHPDGPARSHRAMDEEWLLPVCFWCSSWLRGSPAAGLAGCGAQPGQASGRYRPRVRLEPLRMVKREVLSVARQPAEVVPQEQHEARHLACERAHLVAHVGRAPRVDRDALHVVGR
jgi:SAM-dependent methyltransferase